MLGVSFRVYKLFCFVLGSFERHLYRFYLGCMNFSFAHLKIFVLRITSCASGVTGFEKTINECDLGSEPSWIWVALVCPKVFLLLSLDSSFEYHSLIFFVTNKTIF
jgi:hypothetical protein